MHAIKWFVALAAVLALAADGRGFFMPWLCLSTAPDCRKTQGDVKAQVDQLTRNADLFPYVSFSFFGLTANGTVDITGIFCPKCVTRQLQAAGIKACGMLTMANGRHLQKIINFVRNPNAMREVAGQVVAYDLDCVNIDIEWRNYGERKMFSLFIGELKAYLATHTVSNRRPNGATVIVDLPDNQHPTYWGGLYADVSGALANNTGPQAYIAVEMYAYHVADFEKDLRTALRFVAPEQLVVGLSQHLTSGGLSDTEVQQRFDTLAAHNICRGALWQTPVPGAWFPHLRAMSARCGGFQALS